MIQESPIVFVLFYLRTSKKNKKGCSPIYCRITVDSMRAEFSTGRFISESRWSFEASQVKGTGIEARSINEYMDSLKSKIRDIENKLIQKEEDITSSKIRNLLLGKDVKKRMFLEVLNEYVKTIEIGIDTPKKGHLEEV